MQRYTVYLYLETALHVSGGTSTHHQERIFTMFIFNYAMQTLRLIVRSTFQLSPPGVSTHVTTREHTAAEGGTVGKKFPGILA
jgi:hypothetical protein